MQRHVLPAPPAPLPPGHHVEGYELLACVGEDLDGFVYRAMDRRSHREVAIREFFPVGLVEREGDRVQAWPGVESEYSRLLARWIVVVDHLALVDHPALVRVEDYWLRSGTAYVLTPWVDGQTLRARRDKAAGEFGRADIEAWVGVCCDAIDLLHRGGDVHGSLSPERLTVLASGQLVLPLPDMDPSRQPYSLWLAPEQAERPPGGWQVGPWTDVHGIAAIAHWLFTGAPPPGLARRQSGDADIWQPLDQAVGEGPWRDGIVRALSPDPSRRPASVVELREALGLPAAPVSAPRPAAIELPVLSADLAVPVLEVQPVQPGLPDLPVLQEPEPVPASPTPAPKPAPTVSAPAAPARSAGWSAVPDQPVSQVSITPQPLSRRKPTVTPARATSRHRGIVGGMVAFLVLGVGALMFQRQPAGPAPAETARATSPTATPALPPALDQLPPTAAGPAAAAAVATGVAPKVPHAPHVPPAVAPAKAARPVAQAPAAARPAAPVARVVPPTVSPPKPVAPRKLAPLPPKPAESPTEGDSVPKPARHPAPVRAAPGKAASDECIDLLRRRSLESAGSRDDDAAFKTVCR